MCDMWWKSVECWVMSTGIFRVCVYVCVCWICCKLHCCQFCLLATGGTSDTHRHSFLLCLFFLSLCLPLTHTHENTQNHQSAVQKMLKTLTLLLFGVMEHLTTVCFSVLFSHFALSFSVSLSLLPLHLLILLPHGQCPKSQRSPFSPTSPSFSLTALLSFFPLFSSTIHTLSLHSCSYQSSWFWSVWFQQHWRFWGTATSFICPSSLIQSSFEVGRERNKGSIHMGLVPQKMSKM